MVAGDCAHSELHAFLLGYLHEFQSPAQATSILKIGRIYRFMCVAHLQRGDSLGKELSKQFSPMGLVFYPSYFMLEHTFENFNLMEICSYSTYYSAEHKFLLVAR